MKILTLGVMALLLISCRKEDPKITTPVPQPDPDDPALAPLAGTWERFKYDGWPFALGVPVNPPDRDTLTIFINSRYTWKGRNKNEQGKIRVVNGNQVQTAPNGGSWGFGLPYTITGNELKLTLWFGNDYYRRF